MMMMMMMMKRRRSGSLTSLCGHLAEQRLLMLALRSWMCNPQMMTSSPLLMTTKAVVVSR